MHVIIFLEIKRLKKNIENVACSLPLCTTRNFKNKMLGGHAPAFFFYLKEFAESNKESKFLVWARVRKIIRNKHRAKRANKCCGNHVGDSIEERDIVDATKFLRDTGLFNHPFFYIYTISDRFLCWH
jgi:hypothetical protein